MGFNKYYVPEPAELAKQISEKGPTGFFSDRKIDAMIGSTESVRMVELVLGLLKLKTPDSDIQETLKGKFPAYFN